jgi:hypothetical protein
MPRSWGSSRCRLHTLISGQSPRLAGQHLTYKAFAQGFFAVRYHVSLKKQMLKSESFLIVRRTDVMVNPETVSHMETFFKNNDIHFHEMVDDVQS